MEEKPNMQLHPGYPPPAYSAAQQPTPSIIAIQPAITPGVPAITPGVVAKPTNPPMGSQPLRMTCPHCRVAIVTQIEYSSTAGTHCLACLLCCIFLPCVVIPYSLDLFKTASHYCPNCGAYFGEYSP